MVRILGCGSGVSSASALSAGDDSAPDVSDSSSISRRLGRGVLNEGLRNGVPCGLGCDAKELVDCEEMLRSDIVSLSIFARMGRQTTYCESQMRSVAAVEKEK